ncbi:hypothetical protein DEU56DRAFT_752465 [Suillus clintonianus]|uniref:uncharacterized protein n=1 Tax=Suillus clintonianus TaxID=1904413 RepID=UPI001B860D2E|nr:uncharacterized protein DEU56DRAFT_752465 [Suillus clintonianus]KAG2150799.1 hypothetical protein DEU56DRAFT_752465 [Suillus clintonianus]
MDNIVSYGTDVLKAHPDYRQKVLDVYRTAMTSPQLEDNDKINSVTLPLAVDCSEKLDVRGNCIVMDVENFLIGWPTYMVEFTPKKPGPVKLTIHLKDASKGVWVEDEDSDAETVIVVSTKTRKSSFTRASTIHNADTTLVSDVPSESKNDTQLVSATPVHLIGIPKNLRLQTIGADWHNLLWREV